MKRNLWSLAALFVAAAFFVVPAHRVQAQSITAVIHGTVTDTTGAVIPGASVTVLNGSTGITTKAKADGSGYYVVTNLQIGGPYSVTVTANGFKAYVQTGLTLNVGTNRQVNAQMQVGSESTTVEVNATALQVETANTQLQQTITQQQISQIPLAGRDASGLQKLEPGVVESSDRFGTFSTDGSQTPQNSYLVNGIDIGDAGLQSQDIAINPDALQEESVTASTLNPDVARNSGATVIQVVKAGTNQFHGNVFEFYRDTFMNSRPYFAQAQPEFHQNLYGATLGGPVVRNKLFFFLAYQGFRQRTGADNTAPTMTDQNFAGNFANDLNFATGVPNNTPKKLADGTTVNDSLTGNPIPFPINGCPAGTAWNICFNNPNSTISVPTADWNSLASSITTEFIPQPNFLGTFYNFNTTDTAAEDQGIVRVDYTPTASDSIWASSIFESNPATNTLSFGGGSFPGFGMRQASHIKMFSVNYTHTFNATTLNTLHGGYFRLNFPAVIPQHVETPSSYGFSGIVTQNTAQAGFPYMLIGSFALGNSFEGPQPRVDTNLTYGDDFTKIVGAHSLKFGFSYEQFRVDNPFSLYNNGLFEFAGGTAGGGAFSSGDPILDFELGIPDIYEQTNNGDINARSSEMYAYAQDSWKLTQDVVVNYGIAWDVEAPTTNAQFDHLGIVCWENTNYESKIFPGAPRGLMWPGDSGCNTAGSPTTHYNRFGPRVGIAWAPSKGPALIIGEPGTHSFSVRAGYGIYYNRDQEEQSLQNLEDPPFLITSLGALNAGLSSSLAEPFVDVAGRGSAPQQFPFTPPAAGDTNIDWPNDFSELALATFTPDYSVPYTQNFNLNIQRALPSNMRLQIGYVGSLSHRLSTWYDGDYITPAGHAACFASPTCTADAGNIHLDFPQYTSVPDIVPGTEGFGTYGNGIPWYRSVARQNTEGASNYNSLQMSLIKATTHGLYFTLAYTYSHALDDGSGYESITGQGGTNSLGHVYIYTPGFKYLNYGDSDFDARNRFVASYVYQIPVFSAIRDNAILRESIAGWEVSGVTALQSGYPVAFTQGQNRSLWCDGNSYFSCGDVPMTSTFHIKHENPRKVQTLMVNGQPQTGHFFFDPSSFSNEPVGTYGNAKRNFFHGPGYNYTNLQLSKNFRLSKNNEQRYFQLRVEGFNVFNHVNFAPPSSQFSSPTSFGQTTGEVSSGDPNGDPAPAREFQLVGKFYF